MYFPEIPDNSLTERIRTIIELSNKLAETFGESAFQFEKPISNEEIILWETEHNIRIPDSYKEWLYFSKRSDIASMAVFYAPDNFIIPDDEKSFDVPAECIVIGELGGWGVSICFYPETGEIMYIDHGEECRNLDFRDILDWVIDSLECSI